MPSGPMALLTGEWENIFTVFESQTWLPDFHLGMNPFGNVTARPIWTQATRSSENNTVISFYRLSES